MLELYFMSPQSTRNYLKHSTPFQGTLKISYQPPERSGQACIYLHCAECSFKSLCFLTIYEGGQILREPKNSDWTAGTGNMSQIKLKSSDNEIFTVDVEIAKCSVTIKTMLEDLGMEEGEEDAVPLPNVTSEVLRKVIEWATYHKDDPPIDENEEKRSDDIIDWDIEFLKVDEPILFQLVLAANYLDIRGLLDLTCKTVANLYFKRKTTEQIREALSIQNDFTPEEEEQVRQECEWCQEKTDV